MKKIFFILLIFVCFKSFGQFPQGQSVSGPTYNYVFRGGVQSMKGFINAKYTDTTAANADYVDFYTGTTIYTTADQNFWIRDTLPMRWTRLANFSELDGGYFYPNQTSVGTTTHDANYNNFFVNNIGTSLYTAGTNGNYSIIQQDSTLLLLYALHNATATSSQFELRPDSIRFLPFHGPINIDSLRVGSVNDSIMVWNKQSGIVGYRDAASFGGSGSGGSGNIYNMDSTLANYRIVTGDDKSITWTFDGIDSSGFVITSNSSSAANDRLRVLDVEFTGINANQATFAGYFSNTGSGSGSTKIAIYGVAPNGYGVYGESNNGVGVLGRNPNGTAVFGISDNNQGVHGEGGSVGVYGLSVNGTAVYADGNGGDGLYAQSVAGLAGNFKLNGSNSEDLIRVVVINRSGGASPQDTVGGILDLEVTDSINTRFLFQWQKAYSDSRVGRLRIQSVTDAILHENLTLSGPKSTLYSRDSMNAQTVERYTVFGNYKDLTESSPTQFITIQIPDSTVTGGEILVTVEANDSTDFQSRTLRFIWSAINKSGTTTITFSTPEESFAESAGGSTLTATITAVDAGSGIVDFKINAVSSLTQTILRCSSQIFKNIGTGFITAQ